MNDREPVRPSIADREGKEERGDMCEVDEEDVLDRTMRPFNPDIEERGEGGGRQEV